MPLTGCKIALLCFSNEKREREREREKGGGSYVRNSVGPRFIARPANDGKYAVAAINVFNE